MCVCVSNAYVTFAPKIGILSSVKTLSVPINGNSLQHTVILDGKKADYTPELHRIITYKNALMVFVRTCQMHSRIPMCVSMCFMRCVKFVARRMCERKFPLPSFVLVELDHCNASFQPQNSVQTSALINAKVRRAHLDEN